MKRIKFLILLFILFLTGCSVEYNLQINEDDTISEYLTASEKTDRLESMTRLKDKQATSYLYNMFKRDNENININYTQKDNYTYAYANTSHDSLQEYATKFKSDIFDKVTVEKNDSIVSFYSVQSKLINNNSSYSLLYDDITINIKIPFKVIENNADSVKNDIYTWKISESDKLKEIKFSYEENSLKEKLNIKVNNKTYNINYWVIFTGVLVFIILFIIIFIFIKNKKNNIV